MITHQDIVLEAGEAVNITNRLGVPSTSRLILQCKDGIALVNNTGMNEGYKLVNNISHEFASAPQPIFVKNPSRFSVRIAVLEVPKES